MQQSTVAIPTAEPISLNLSPRDCFCMHAAVEAALLEVTILDLDDEALAPNRDEAIRRMQDLETRLRNLLRAGGHLP